MRKSFATSITELGKDPNYIFITGDLGFMALESVKESFGTRFINAGVAEQNMIGVAAGLAKDGFKVFVYSIAPFCYARPFEQIRNDICLAKLPVCLVGNGGGYAYGYMGPTHHALEDCAAMNALGVKVLVPSFDEDIPLILNNINSASYLRLGFDARPKDSKINSWEPWRKVVEGSLGVIVALGPLAGNAMHACLDIPFSRRPSVWAVTDFSESEVPQLFWDQAEGKDLYVIEEHVQSGGIGSILALLAVRLGINFSNFHHRFALRYPSGRYGSQEFHRIECGLDINGIKNMVFGKV